MAAAVTEIDLMEGAQCDQTERGWEISRMFLVKGLTGNGYDRLGLAVVALNNYGIHIGDSHPTVTNATVVSISPEALTPEDAKLLVRYKSREYQLAQYDVGGSVVSEQTNMDYLGNPITLQHTYPQSYPEQERAGTTETAGVLVNKYVPNIPITIKRTEYFDLDGTTPISGLAITARAQAYVGKVNGANWSIGGVTISAAARSWLCATLKGTSNDGGLSYNVEYTFMSKGQDNAGNDLPWDTHVAFMDPNTGKPVADLVADESEKDVQIYAEANFNLLNLA